jgi:hypothetical protein
LVAETSILGYDRTKTYEDLVRQFGYRPDRDCASVGNRKSLRRLPEAVCKLGRRVKDILEKGLCVVGLGVLLYVGAYFAAARRGPTFQWSGCWVAWPRYFGLPDSSEACFRRLHEWDRSVLRPGFWAGAVPPEQRREQQLLACEVALKAAQESLKQQ